MTFRLSDLIIILAAAFTVPLAAAAELSNGMTLSTPIWDKADMRLICLAGATGGAFIYLYLSSWMHEEHASSQKEHIKRLAAKFLSSWISGMLFTPLVIRWFSVPADPDIVLGLSGSVALIATSIIHKALPQINSWILSKLPRAQVKHEDEPETEL